LPFGCPYDIDVVSFLNALLVNPATGYALLKCALRNGRMYFNLQQTSRTASAQYYVYFYFAEDVNAGPANQCFGFPSPKTVYKVQPDHGGAVNAGTDGSMRLNSYDGCPNTPSEAATSPQLINCNPLTAALLLCQTVVSSNLL